MTARGGPEKGMDCDLVGGELTDRGGLELSVVLPIAGHLPTTQLTRPNDPASTSFPVGFKATPGDEFRQLSTQPAARLGLVQGGRCLREGSRKLARRV